MCLQNSCHDGVGPEALCWTVLGLHLLGFGSRVGVTGVQHGLKDTPTGVDKPVQYLRRERMSVSVNKRILLFTRQKLNELYFSQLKKNESI